MTAAKENIITDILVELEKGKLYKEVSLVIISKYQFTEPTFVRYWKKANERYAERQIKANERADNERERLSKERLKKAILKRDEIAVYLSTVAKIMVAKITGDKENPDPAVINSFNNVANSLSKLEGWNMPSKIAQTDVSGKDVKTVDLTEFLSPKKLMELRKLAINEGNDK